MTDINAFLVVHIRQNIHQMIKTKPGLNILTN